MDDNSGEAGPHASDTAADDSQLETVAAELLRLDPDGSRTAQALRRTFDMLLDGANTGRFRWDQLHKTEKTHCGTLVEINLQRAFGFADGNAMDFSICGADVDCKYSQDLGKWMIPPEAMGHLCLGLWANDQQGKWAAGLFRVTGGMLTADNRDKKRSLTAAARDSRVRWLFRDAPLPENVLLHLTQADIEAIFASAYGTKRTDELFRRAQGKIVSRNVVATVAMQDDPLKRVRYNGGSRTSLRPEGIVIFGQYSVHGRLAYQLGLPVPGPGEFVSARLASAQQSHAGVPRIRLDGGDWVLAGPNDPPEPAPMLPKTNGKEES